MDCKEKVTQPLQEQDTDLLYFTIQMILICERRDDALSILSGQTNCIVLTDKKYFKVPLSSGL